MLVQAVQRDTGRRLTMTVEPVTDVLSWLGLDERAWIGIFGDPAVARQHAEIEATTTDYILRHLTLQAFTRVNGTPVRDLQSLKDGDRIELGKTLLVFRRR
jgi:hypothetical protein